ncbi:hypothetical protein LUZ61_020906 [Rhynchospora tenuis]|uniref:Integrase catalytic domain-containing protein n=1 Tax=Rhynchospora tenuis TaxID=198213 RepID=A0AAD6EP97_9POAL|nr:hypothetical protein LUZ61_020906 [Rhynchospora tenuis]
MASETVLPNDSPHSSSTLTPPLISQTTDSIVSLNLPIASKLTDTNFLNWKSQVLPLIYGYSLGKFIDSPPPDPTLRSEAGQIVINPEYLPWYKQDQLLLGWIRSSLSDSVMAQVVSCSTTKELWHTLQQYFASTSRARLTDLRRQIQTAHKGDASCSTYLQQLKTVADELAFIGAPVSEDELVSYTINGLGIDYNSIVAAVNTASRSAPFSFSDLRGLLLGHEALLKSQATQPVAFAASRGSAGTRFRAPQPNQYFNNQIRPNNFNFRPPTPQFRPNTPLNLPLNASSPASQTKPTCQICSKYGHPAKLCYKRYDPDSDWVPNPRFQAFNAQPTSAAATSTSSTANQSEWVLDSGASSHVTNDFNNLSTFFAYTGMDTLKLGSGTGMAISHIGSTHFNLSGTTVTLSDILVVPNFSTNLISISKLLQDNPQLCINFTASSCIFKVLHTKTNLHEVLCKNGLYLLDLNYSPQAFFGIRAPASVWHARLGHPSNSTTKQILQSFSLPCDSNKLSFCSDCAQSKAHVLPFSSSSSISTSPLQLVHSDVWGPAPIVSSLGYKYYITFVDDYSNYTWIYFLKQKSDVLNVFSLFKSQAENLLNTSIKTLRTDGGTEYKPVATKFPQIQHQTSCPYTPQQNGKAERKHRNIVELALAIMSQSSIPTLYWDEIFSNVVYLINRLPSNMDIPYKKLFHKDPDFTFLKVLGCLCFPLTRPYNAHKLEQRSLPCVFIGYAKSQKGYRCLHLPTNRIYISRNVLFDEHTFPFKQQQLPSTNFQQTLSLSTVLPVVFPSAQNQVNNSAQQADSQPQLEPQVSQPVSTSTVAATLQTDAARFSNDSADRPQNSNLSLTAAAQPPCCATELNIASAEPIQSAA